MFDESADVKSLIVHERCDIDPILTSILPEATIRPSVGADGKRFLPA